MYKLLYNALAAQIFTTTGRERCAAAARVVTPRERPVKNQMFLARIRISFDKSRANHKNIVGRKETNSFSDTFFVWARTELGVRIYCEEKLVHRATTRDTLLSAR